MPRPPAHCINENWVAIIERLRDEKNKDDGHAWTNYNRAAKSLRSHPERINTPKDLKNVPYIGPVIVSAVTKALNKGSDDDAPGPSTKRKSSGGSKKTTADTRKRQRRQEIDEGDGDAEDFSEAMGLISPPKRARPAAGPSRATANIPTAHLSSPDFSRWGVPPPGQGHAVPGVFPPPVLQPSQASSSNPLDKLSFSYVDLGGRRVSDLDNAAFDTFNDELYFKIEFPRTQANHLWVARNTEGISPGKDTSSYYAFLKGSIAQRVPVCHGLPQQQEPVEPLPKAEPIVAQPKRPYIPPTNAPVPLVQRSSTSGGPSNQLLQNEFAKQLKRPSMTSVDPSRTASQEVMAALARLKSNAPTSKPINASSQAPVEPTHIKTEADERRDRIAAAALARQRSSIGTKPTSSVSFQSSPEVAPLPRASTSSRPSNLANSASLPTVKPNERPLMSQQKSAPEPSRPSIPSSSQALQRVKTVPNPETFGLRGPRISSHTQAPQAIGGLEYELEGPQFVDRPLPQATLPGQQPTGIDVTQPFQPHVLPTGSYHIQMILDNREIKNRDEPDAILIGLQDRGVSVRRGALPIGDAAWTAVRKHPLYGEPQICVLDALLERKRMDDLCTSIKDGRFHEQKFRLRESGIGQVYYLVEHYNTRVLRKDFDLQINTALSSTQVVDGFMVKETSSVRDTIGYLATVHKAIEKLYEGKPLYIIPHHRVQRSNYTDLQRHLRTSQPSKIYHTTYTDFERLNLKSSLMPLKDCWAHMLLTINGLSAEKVAALLEHFRTPIELYEWFLEAERKELEDTWKERAEMEEAATLGKGKGRAKKSKVVKAMHSLTLLPGEGRKKIGPALSEKIYTLFRAQRY